MQADTGAAAAAAAHAAAQAASICASAQDRSAQGGCTPVPSRPPGATATATPAQHWAARRQAHLWGTDPPSTLRTRSASPAALLPSAFSSASRTAGTPQAPAPGSVPSRAAASSAKRVNPEAVYATPDARARTHAGDTAAGAGALEQGLRDAAARERCNAQHVAQLQAALRSTATGFQAAARESEAATAAGLLRVLAALEYLDRKPSEGTLKQLV